MSGHFGLLGFASLPLYRGEWLSGVLYFGAKSSPNAARLDFAGVCDLSAKAVQVSTALLALPRIHPRLTERQNDVARLAADGLANREIAEELGTGGAAVRKHLKALNRMFETPNRTAMAAGTGPKPRSSETGGPAGTGPEPEQYGLQCAGRARCRP